MEMVNLKINGMPVKAPKGSTILDAARHTGIEIPTLCYMKDINEIGASHSTARVPRICLFNHRSSQNSYVVGCLFIHIYCHIF